MNVTKILSENRNEEMLPNYFRGATAIRYKIIKITKL